MSNFIDLSGKRFGRWTVIERDDDINKKNIYWKCKCDCGTVRSVAGTSLRSGLSVSCGCEKKEKTSQRTVLNVDDMTGRRFGKWLVLERDFSNEKASARGARWICQCDCGNIRSVLGYSLRAGRTSSCGCDNGKTTTVDLTNKRFGNLTVVSKDENYKKGKGAKWICKCDCGNTVSVFAGHLKNGQTRSCGCLRNNSKREHIDLVGDKIGNWTVIKKDLSKKGKGTYYICKCDCGTIRSVSAQSLKNGLSNSCGCLNKKPQYDLIGKRFGSLTVLRIDKDNPNKGSYWLCLCDCGNIKSYQTYHLTNGSVVSCGCVNKKKSSDRKFKDISGQRFGRLTVEELYDKKIDSCGNSEYYWNCICACGNKVVVSGKVLRRGDTLSCGCLRAEQSACRAKGRTIDMTGKRFGLLTVLERVEKDFNNSRGTWKCVCDCGNIKFADGSALRKGLITSCGCLKQSKYELYVLQYFEDLNYINSVDYVCQKRFDDLRGYGEGQLSYDFAVYKKDKLYCLIECQGQQHYMPVDYFGGNEQFAKQMLHDETKANYAKQLNVPLIEIPYTVKSYEEVKDILKSYNI